MSEIYADFFFIFFDKDFFGEVKFKLSSFHLRD